MDRMNNRLKADVMNVESGTQSRPFSRRRFIATASAAAGAVLLSQSHLFGQSAGVVEKIQKAAAGEVTVQQLRGNISVIMGSGGNIAVLPGPDGKVLVDAGISVSQAQIRQALLRISADPIKNLINTHWHFDHTSGNDWLHEAGATITSHETTRRRLRVKHRVEGWRFNFPAAPAGALPSVTFKDKLEMDLNGSHLVMKYYEPAHTDCDISVHFTDADVIHVADTWWHGFYPFIDYSSGGSIDGSIEAAETNVATISDQAVVIPGHGAVGNRTGLIEFRDMLVSIRDNVSKLKEAGMTLEQAVAAKPTAKFDKKWGKFVITPDAFAALVYQGV